MKSILGSFVAFNELVKRKQDSSPELLNLPVGSLSNSSLSHKERGITKKAFTLAEVLITLGIIGIVAVLVTPNLIANYEKKVLSVQLAKFASNLYNAVAMVDAEYGPLKDFSDHYFRAGDGVAGETEISSFKNNGEYEATNYITHLLKKMNAKRVISLRDEYIEEIISGGFTQDGFVTHPTFGRYILPSGAIIMYKTRWGGAYFGGTGHMISCEGYASMMVDVNGKKRPNVVGKDIYTFVFIYPFVHGNSDLCYDGNQSSSTKGICSGEADVFGRVTVNYGKGDRSGVYPSGYRTNSNCTKQRNSMCLTSIMKNGWTIPKDYYWVK